MAVDVYPLNILGGGKRPVTRVQDTFGRGTLNPANQNLWMPVVQTIIPITNPFTYGLPFCNGANQIVLSGQANGNAGSIPTICPCVGLDFGTVNGQQQYCQATFQSLLNAVAIGAGLAVFISWNTEQGASWYGLNFSQSGTPFLERASVSGGVLSTTTLFTAAPGQVAGDVWRLSFNPGTNTVTLTKNSVVVFNAVDGSPLATGIPGFQMRSTNSSAGNCNQVILSNLDCGLGA